MKAALTLRSPARQKSQSGFTLAELTVVLAVLSIIVGSMMLEMVTGSAVRSQEVTITRMQAIEKAMMAYWLAHKRIPCPAAGDATLDSATYGMEQGDPGDCTASGGAIFGRIEADCNNWNNSCPTNCTDDCGAILGVVPVRTLNLPDEYAFDGWNRRLTYIVDERFTKSGTLPYSPALVLSNKHAAPAANDEIGRYPALMISHGRSGSMAFPANGSTLANRPVTLTPNNEEEHNVTTSRYNNRFVALPFRPDLPSGSGRFDQMVYSVSLP